jgi:MYXO-CTERM domain-containing protein
MSRSQILARLAAIVGIHTSLLVATPAGAHIDMEGEVLDRGGDQKTRPCGGASRGDGPIYEFEPGATITLAIDEFIGHDGYFRVTFDDDGDDDFVDPASIDPINPDRYDGRRCLDDGTDMCGESDFCNVVSTTGGPTVLWDNLDPHIAVRSADDFLAAAKWSWNVTLPDIECDNCTLQVMQIMEDPPGHGPFDGVDDLYYRCIDIVLRRGVGSTPGTTTQPVANNGIDCVAEAGGWELDGDPGAGGGASDPAPSETRSSKKKSGCAIGMGGTEPASVWPLLVLGAAVLGRRRWRRR